MSSLRLMILFLLVSPLAEARWRPLKGGELASGLNPLRFTNQSQCALDASKPTDSIFLIVDNGDPGRGLQRLSLALGHSKQQRDRFVKEGIRTFRHHITQLAALIHDRLVSGRLPLLPARLDSELARPLNSYKKAMKTCRSRAYCLAMESYLAKLWSLGRTSRGVKSFAVLDHFESSHFMSLDKREGSGKALKCYHLTKLTGHQAHLSNKKPTSESLEKMAQELLADSDGLKHCDEFDDLTNLSTALYQLELPQVFKRQQWQQLGFDYWHSFKLYMSWAYRFAPESQVMAAPYGEFFKGISFEQTVMMLSRNCQSIVAPECSREQISQNSLRELARSDFLFEAQESDLLSEVPVGAHKELVLTPFKDVNNDVLDFSSYQTTQQWLEHFSKNYGDAKTMAKQQFLQAVSFLDVMVSHVPIKHFKRDLTHAFQETRRESEGGDLLSLFYLCSEFLSASDEQLGFFYKDLKGLGRTEMINELLQGITQHSLNPLKAYYQQVVDMVLPACQRLEQGESWRLVPEVAPQGYRSWYLQKFLASEAVISDSDRLAFDRRAARKKEVYLRYVSGDQAPVCASAVHCARKVLESMIHLRRALFYSDALLTEHKRLMSAHLTNPLAERTACGVYDPWFKSKKLLWDLLWDAGQALLGTSVPALLYTKVNLLPKKASSMREMIQEGRIFYEPTYNQHNLLASLSVDLGPLMTTPCAVEFSPADSREQNSSSWLTFRGLELEACGANQNFVINVDNINHLVNEQTNNLEGCLSCKLKFDSAASSVANHYDALDSNFFLFRGLVRLLNAWRDPEAIPRAWHVNPRYLLESYRSYGQILKSCVGPLSRGRRCLNYECDEAIAQKVSEDYPGMITNIFRTKKGSEYGVRTSQCDQTIGVKVRKRKRDGQLQCRVTGYFHQPACKERK